MMIIQPINTFLMINSVKNHSQHKEKILNLIEKMEKSSMMEGDDRISNTDWNLPRKTKREYMDYFLQNIIKEPINKMADYFKCDQWTIPNVWYQQYYKSDYHDWHLHPDCQFTNVYFVELPSEENKTEIFDLVQNKTVNYFEIKEGDILTIPSCFLHRSKANNNDNQRKTVIAFNTNIFNVDPNKVGVESTLTKINK